MKKVKHTRYEQKQKLKLKVLILNLLLSCRTIKMSFFLSLSIILEKLYTFCTKILKLVTETSQGTTFFPYLLK